MMVKYIASESRIKIQWTPVNESSLHKMYLWLVKTICYTHHFLFAIDVKESLKAYYSLDNADNF